MTPAVMVFITYPPESRSVDRTSPPQPRCGLGRVASAGCGRLGLRQVGFGRLGRLGGAAEGQHRTFAGALAIPVVDVDGDELAGTDLLEEDLLAQRVLELPLDRAPQRPRAQHGVEP